MNIIKIFKNAICNVLILSKKYIQTFFAICVLFVFVLCLGGNAAPAQTYEDITDEITNMRKNSICNIELNAPFKKETSGVREVVNPESGAVNVYIDLFSANGYGNAKSFELSLVYNTASAALKDETAEYNSSKRYYENKTCDKSNFGKSLNSFGIGWTLNMPYVEVQDGKNKSNIYVHTADGAVYKENENEKSGLDKYELSDVVFEKVNISEKGVDIKYRLSYVNGDVYLFDSRGYLCAKHDKFNNVSTYTWTEQTIPLLANVSDNSGDKVSFEYKDNDIEIKLKDRKYVINRIKKDDGYLINSVTDPMDRVTYFNYTESNMHFEFFADTSPYGENTYYLLNEVTYYTGIKTFYEYTVGKKWLYEKENGYIQYAKLLKRFDINRDVNTDIYTYEYYLEPDGYPMYKSDKLPDDYTYTATEKNSLGVKTTYYYNKKHNLVKKDKSINGIMLKKEVTKFDDKTNMPSMSVCDTYSKDGKSKTLYQLYEFDARGNVTKTDTYSDTEKPGINVSEYKYSDLNNMCIYQSAVKDENTLVEVRRTLNKGANGIQSETIFKNGKKIKTDTYTYNEYSNVEKSKVQTSESGYLSTKYFYDEKYSGQYPTKVVQSGIKNADGEYQSYSYNMEYDGFGNITKQTDSDNNVLLYKYDKLNRKTKEVAEDGTAKEYIYNDKDNVITCVNLNGLKLLQFYDKCGRIISVYDTNINQYRLKREYDQNNRVISEQDVLGTKVCYTYDVNDRYLSMIVYDVNGNVLTEKYFSYDDAYINADGKFLKMTVTEGEPFNQKTSEYFFDYKNMLVRKNVIPKNTPNNNLDNAAMYFYEYDLAGNNTVSVSPSGAVTKTEYDIFSNPVHVTYADGTEEFFEYDFNGNLLSHTNGAGETEYAEYDSLSRKIQSSVQNGNGYSVCKSYYDYRGNVLKEINANGGKCEYTYNERGFLENVKQYSKAYGGVECEYLYDNEGNVTQMSYGGIGENKRIKTKYTLDIYGNTLTEKTGSQKERLYEYDNNGSVLKYTDSNGVVTQYEYDGLARVVKTSNSKNGSINYQYNCFGETVSAKLYDIYNNLCDLKQYLYDGFGNVQSVKGKYTSEDFVYDIDGNVISHTINDKDMGTVNTQKTYDVMGRVISTATDIGTENITYDGAGRIAKKTNSVNGTEKIYSYYPNSLVKKIITKQNGTTVYNENYGYDNAGNKTYADLNGDITEYRYDGMNRLLSVNENKTKYTEYEFDGFNNITAEYEISGSSVKKKTYYYDGNNRLVMLAGGNTATRYEYDNEGNVIKMTDGTGSSQRKSFYGYDGANRLSSFSSPDANAEYTYNVDGLRESKTVNGEYTRFMYDGSNVAGEIKNDNYYIYYRATELMGYKSYKGDMYYYRSDSHGNVTALMDYSGKEIKNYSYSPYGRKKALRYVPNGDKTIMYMWKAETETVHNPFGYCGEYCDDETGFVYLRNRMYDPYMSRFISQDPAKDGFNWYVYCEGNPVNFVDPSGYKLKRDIISWMEGKKEGIVKFKTSGFLYSKSEDIFYSVADAWQRNFGYCNEYDKVADKYLNIDTLKFYFQYNDFTWRIQLWKGDYGISTGCEIGVYYAEGNADDNAFYDAVKWDDMLEMSSYLKYNNEIMFRRNPVETWWLTAFRFDGCKDPEKLTMGMTINFKNRTMRDEFINSVNKEINNLSKKDSEKLEIQFSTDINDQKIWLEWRGTVGKK